MLFPVLIGVSDFFCKRNVPMRIIGKKTVIIEIFYHILKKCAVSRRFFFGFGVGLHANHGIHMEESSRTRWARLASIWSKISGAPVKPKCQIRGKMGFLVVCCM